MSRELSLVVLIAIVLGMESTGAAEESKFKITMKRDNDEVEVTLEENTAIFSVRSPLGISQAVVERTGKHWPGEVKLRLHLKGLENFKVTNGKVTLEAAVSSQGDQQPVRLWKDGDEAVALEAKDPYWIDVHMFSNAREPTKTIPLVDGYFEMRLPKALFDGNPESITINWIDFYR